MGFYIQDDFWEAMEEQPAKVQDEVLGALTRLFFTGEVAAELKGVSKVLFVAFRDRVLIARKRSEAGKSKRQPDEEELGDESNGQSNANQNGNQKPIKTESKPGTSGNQTEEQNGIKTGIKNESNGQSNANQNGNQNSNDLLKSESESESKSKSLDPPNVGSKEKRFSPPTPEEVSAYAAERNGSIDAERFCDFYASKGWKVGTSPMKDWKAAARNWMRNNQGTAKKKGAMNDETAFYAGLDL